MHAIALYIQDTMFKNTPADQQIAEVKVLSDKVNALHAEVERIKNDLLFLQ